PIFKKIEGREDDIFVALDGTLIHGHYFNHIVRILNGFSQFQIIQTDKNNMVLKVVKGEKWDENELTFFLSEVLKKMGNVNIVVEYVNEIPLSPSGKTRYAIRAFEL
ncbi:MAG: phenylacetate--CoA ligase family protein, partial [Bacillota bacterium]